MVSTASAAAQANEVEKKRKHTLERAKANHLSRQLQMRLQYARLKVEHGWQRQNLNEVENLYFHHSHQRGPKSFIPTQADRHMSILSSSRYSDPSYKLWLQSQSGSSNLDTLPEKVSATGNPPTIPLLPNSDSSNITLRTPSTTPVPVETRISHPPENPPTPAGVPAPISQMVPSLQDSPGTPVSSRTHSHPPPTAASTSMQESASSSSSTLLHQSQPTTTLPFTSGGTSFTPATPTPTPITLSKTKASSGSKNNPPLTSKEMFGSSNTSLTYDSFWSGLQSKSYPTLKSGGQTGATTGSAVNGASGVTLGGFPQGPPTTSSFTPISTAPAPSVVPVQNPSSTTTSTSTPSPLILPQAQPPATTSLSLSSTSPSGPSMSTPVPTSLVPPPFSALVPITTPLPMPTSLPIQHIPPHVQMTMPNRYLSDNIVPWNFVPTTQQQQQQQQPPGTPGLMQQHHLIPTSLLVNPAAFPFLANLSASYAQAFGAITSQATQGHGTPNVGVAASDGSVGQATPGAVPPSTGPMSPTALPVVSAFVGQQKS